MGINSRSKGNRNERLAASLFKTWTKKEFARTPSSGGLQWKSTNSKGDIVCTTEGHYFPFCVEVKAHKEIDFSHLLNPKIKLPKILEFWAQCKRDAKLANKIPMLLMRYDNMPKELFFLVIPYGFGIKLADLLPTDRVVIQVKNYKTKEVIYIFNSTEFFKVHYKSTKLIAKTHIKNESHK